MIGADVVIAQREEGERPIRNPIGSRLPRSRCLSGPWPTPWPIPAPAPWHCFSGIVREQTGDAGSSSSSTRPTRRWPPPRCGRSAAELRARWPRVTADRDPPSGRTPRHRGVERHDRRLLAPPGARPSRPAASPSTRLKETVPVWKKEYFEDGEVWVGLQSECDHRH